MSKVCGFPPSMVAEAREIQAKVRNLFPVLIRNEEVDQSAFVVSNILQRLSLLKNSSLDDVSLCHYLNNLRAHVSQESIKLMKAYLSRFEDEDKSNHIEIEDFPRSDIHTDVQKETSGKEICSREEISCEMNSDCGISNCSKFEISMALSISVDKRKRDETEIGDENIVRTRVHK